MLCDKDIYQKGVCKFGMTVTLTADTILACESFVVDDSMKRTHCKLMGWQLRCYSRNVVLLIVVKFYFQKGK